jgi:O-methyltransferase
LKRAVRAIARRMGFDITRYSPAAATAPPLAEAEILEEEFRRLSEIVRPYTMTSVERMYGLYKATEYVVANRIAGDFVECGVWKGGSTMLMALALQHFGQANRHIHLYDTFRGMSRPEAVDRSYVGEDAQELWTQSNEGDVNRWCMAPLDEVRANVTSTGYPPDLVHYVEGKVEDTLPATIPEQIALLRLDTDWYESTRHELTHLFPRLSPGGVVILDDYGYWRGARKATDEYFTQAGLHPLMVRLDNTGRLILKTG